MKKLIIIVLVLSSCKVTKIDKQGNVVPTANTKHINKIHPKGFWYSKGFVQPKEKSDDAKTVKL